MGTSNDRYILISPYSLVYCQLYPFFTPSPIFAMFISLSEGVHTPRILKKFPISSGQLKQGSCIKKIGLRRNRNNLPNYYWMTHDYRSIKTSKICYSFENMKQLNSIFFIWSIILYNKPYGIHIYSRHK